MYELFVLGELSDGPMHGYLLHEVLVKVLGPTRGVSWGTLYPVLKHLDEQSYIHQVDGGSLYHGRARKVYEITAIGRGHFFELMAKPLAHNADADDIFRIKLSKFHLIDVSLRREILHQYKMFLDFVLNGLVLNQERVTRESAISEAERPDIVQAIDYQIHSYTARLVWVTQKLECLGGTE
ncbi:MAG: PadR family transcriptional regulator [Sulfobacillus acidophilus]|uniref:PadR family transcriptional regulator n=1 Tax=Sulfobacillus acidophilus TaxID=53633 RepID=A0A2T2WJR4_9FIRM|nr:MAG: PadR family transcriptional regulator [Sulfobacillus acidophilus]